MLVASDVAGTDPMLVRGLQERAARALPATIIERVGGWWLRHAPDRPWWVGTVLPHGDGSPADLARRVEIAERFYAGVGRPTCIQISPSACPPGLVALLAERGYRTLSPISLQVAPVASLLASLEGAPGSAPVDVDERLSPTWIEGWRATRTGPAEPQAMWELAERVGPPSGYASVGRGAEVVAIGRAVADDGWAGVFDVATVPSARRQGAAGAVLAALARWAAGHGARWFYLQVEPDNVPALARYRRAGFRELCRSP
jgi:N-acetylglutamate synthase